MVHEVQLFILPLQVSHGDWHIRHCIVEVSSEVPWRQFVTQSLFELLDSKNIPGLQEMQLCDAGVAGPGQV